MDVPTLAHAWANIILRPVEEEIAKSALNAAAQVNVLILMISKCQVGGIAPKGVAGVVDTP